MLPLCRAVKTALSEWGNAATWPVLTEFRSVPSPGSRSQRVLRHGRHGAEERALEPRAATAATTRTRSGAARACPWARSASFDRITLGHYFVIPPCDKHLGHNCRHFRTRGPAAYPPRPATRRQDRAPRDPRLFFPQRRRCRSFLFIRVVMQRSGTESHQPPARPARPRPARRVAYPGRRSGTAHGDKPQQAAQRSAQPRRTSRGVARGLTIVAA